ncbi:MAG: biopolymer transporter ExbD [Myxococcales bacterium]|nr:biopolymer transporter ExbD [Myxococcales bacterium]
MKGSRRIKRMSRNRSMVPKMNLTSLMDVFTILVFFLLVNSATTEVLETPKQIKLPASVVEEKPRETIVVFVSPDEITVQGEVVARTQDVIASDAPGIPAIGARLAELGRNIIGLNTRNVARSQEVTILADREVPFAVLKRVMSTCTAEGYERISLAVLQKAPETALSQN